MGVLIDMGFVVVVIVVLSMYVGHASVLLLKSHYYVVPSTFSLYMCRLQW